MNSWQWKTTRALCSACLPASPAHVYCIILFSSQQKKKSPKKSSQQKTNRTNTHTSTANAQATHIQRICYLTLNAHSTVLITSGARHWKGTYFFCLHSFQTMLLLFCFLFFCCCVIVFVFCVCCCCCFLLLFVCLFLGGKKKKKHHHQSKHSEDRHSKQWTN